MNNKEDLHGVETIAMFCRLNIQLNKNLPIGTGELGLLLFIATSEHSVTPLMASKFFGVGKPRVTAIVRTLAQQEYLNKEPSKEDLRSYHLVLTKKGEALISDTREQYFRMTMVLKNELGESKFREFVDLLEESNKILENIK